MHCEGRVDLIIEETERGQLRLQNDEAIVDSKVADQAGVRVGSRVVPGENGGGGKISFDLITEAAEQNRRTEAAFIRGGISHDNKGEISITIWDGTEPITDASQKKVMQIRHNEIEFNVPVKGLSGGGSSVLTSPNGRVALVAQDDGNLVLYVDGVPVLARFGLPPDQLF